MLCCETFGKQSDAIKYALSKDRLEAPSEIIPTLEIDENGNETDKVIYVVWYYPPLKGE